MDDLISRKAAIDTIERMKPYQLDGDDCIEIIANLPTAEPRKGHWVFSQDDEYEYCTCSECGNQNGENWLIGGEIPFCSYCGAKMVEGETNG